MTETPIGGDGLGAIIARTRWLLIDFDGPICSIFAGLPAPTVADQLRKVVTGLSVPLPEEVERTLDPMEVFAWSATISPELAERVEAELTAQEVAAVATAEPTSYIHDVLAACSETGRNTAVVSNNSEQAVQTYLTRHGLADRTGPVFARSSHDPALLKPNPHLIDMAIRAISADPSSSVLVGDSITDIDGARQAGIDSIGYADKPGKRDRMINAGAGSVVDSMADLALSIRASKSSLSRLGKIGGAEVSWEPSLCVSLTLDPESLRMPVLSVAELLTARSGCRSLRHSDGCHRQIIPVQTRNAVTRSQEYAQ